MSLYKVIQKTMQVQSIGVGDKDQTCSKYCLASCMNQDAIRGNIKTN